MMSPSDFPLLVNHPAITYLDSASTMHKPQAVIDAVNYFVSHEYANIHRGVYSLAERAENAYDRSKQLLAQWVGTKAGQIAYVSNATMGSNLIAQTLAHNGLLIPGSKILMPMSEHHAMIVPRQIVAQKYGCEIIYCPLNDDYRVDMEAWNHLYTSDVSVVVCGHISNVTGAVLDIAHIKESLRTETIMIVDASQSVQHIPLEFDDGGYDFAILTGHKIMGYTGIGAVLIHPKRNHLTPIRGGGGIIEDVTMTSHRLVKDVSKREPGTPDIIGAVSLGAAIEYLTTHGGYEMLQTQEYSLLEYCLNQFQHRHEQITLIGPHETANRVGIFSFVVNKYPQHAWRADRFAQHQVCVRAGGHCTHPLWQSLGIHGAIRMSLGPYNTLSDCERFFEILDAGIAFKASQQK